MSRSALRHRRVAPANQTPGLGAYERYALELQPRLSLRLDGTPGGLYDLSGHGHHASAHGSPGTGPAWVDGGSTIEFNGTTQYVEVPDHPMLSVTGSGMLTVSAWMSPSTLTFPKGQGGGGPNGGDYCHWMGKGFSPHAEWVSRMYHANPEVEPLRHSRISGYVFSPAGDPVTNPNNLGAGSYFQDPWVEPSVSRTWVNYTLVINTIDVSAAYPTGYVKLYRDGELRDKDRLADFAVVPGHGSDPLRFGTCSLASFFAGSVTRVNLFNRELSASEVRGLEKAGRPGPPTVGNFVKHLGSDAQTASGTRLRITVPAGGVPAGATLLVRAGHPYTVAGPTISDTRGNVWTRDRSGADAGNLIRGSMFSCQVINALQAGDIIEMRTSVAVANRVFLVSQFSGLKFVPVHSITSTQGTSTTPGTTLSVTSSVPEAVLHGAVVVGGPTADGFAEDTVNDMTPMVRAGTNTGADDTTVNGGFRVATTTGVKHFAPVLAIARTWLAMLGIYESGTPTWTPPPAPTATARSVLQASGSSAALTWTMAIPGEGILAGRTLVLAITHDFTSAVATVSDSRGNVWTMDRSAPVTGNAARVSVYSCPLTTALQGGDLVTITWAVVVTRKAATLLEVSGLAVPTSIDSQNGASGASGSPATTLTTVNDDTFLVAVAAMAGPANSAYLSDIGWESPPPAGTSGNGSADRALYVGYKAVVPHAGYPFAPQIDGSYPWALALVAYRTGIVPPVVAPTGTGQFVKNLGSASASASGTTVQIVVPAGGVPAGHTVMVSVCTDQTSGAPSAADVRGNVWTRDRSSTDSTTLRTTLFSAPITTPLQAGDLITVTLTSSVLRRSATADQYSGLLVPTAVDGADGRKGNSNSPTISLTTVTADTVVVTAVGMATPSSSTYLEATSGLWATGGYAGTTDAGGAGDRSIVTAHRSVASAGTYTHAPTLSAPVAWVSAVVAYRAA